MTCAVCASVVALVFWSSDGFAQPADSTQVEAEPIESYLERHGLTEFVVTLLEEELQTELGSDRTPIAERLAAMYGRMFDEAQTPEERERWTQKSIALLERVPEVDTPILRLNLAKAKYLRAESIAERYRLRSATHDEMLTARRMMSEAGASFEGELRDFRSQIRRIENLRIDPRDQTKTDEASSQLDTLDGLSTQAAYYAGWSNYYEGWLAGTADDLQEALLMFGQVLEGKSVEPALQELPTTLLGFEHVARSALGTALTLSASGRPALALEWMDRIDISGTHEAVRKQLPAYRLWILFDRVKQDLEEGNTPSWQAIRAHVDDVKNHGEMTPTFARLLAVLSLEAAEQSTGADEARQLAGEAIAQLSDMNQLSQVLEIAEEFNLDVLGKNSFAIAYVLALRTHYRAREAHGSDEPTTDSQLVRMYNESQKQLEQAASRRDAEDFAAAAAHARLLAAWARYFASEFDDAAESFRKVADILDRDDRETALWMRIVCLDRLRKGSPSDDAKSRLITALNDFLEDFPSSARSGRVRYQLAVLDDNPPSLERVESLLAISPTSDAYAFAQRAAEQMLYSLFRSADGMHRIDLGHRYLNVSMPLVQDAARKLFAGNDDSELRTNYVTWTRRALDVLLTRGISRVSDARKLLDRLRTARAAGLIELTDCADELQYRDFQVLLLSGKYEDATALCDQMWRSDSENRFARAAMQELISRDLQDYHAFPLDAGSEDALRRILTFGNRLLGSDDAVPELDNSNTIALTAAVAEAAFALHTRGADRDSSLLNRAKALYAALLEKEPSNFAFLKANAEIAELDGRTDQALECWRDILTRLAPTDMRWFEAKYNLVRVLADVDRDRALEVIEQHELLNPSYGPSPWGEKLEAIAKELRSAPAKHDVQESESNQDENDAGPNDRGNDNDG